MLWTSRLIKIFSSYKFLCLSIVCLSLWLYISWSQLHIGNIKTKQVAGKNTERNIQSERQETLINGCKRWVKDFDGFSDNGSPWAMYCHRYKFAICDVRKCGSTSWLGFTLVADGYYTVDDFINGKVVGDNVLALLNKKIRLGSPRYYNQDVKAMWANATRVITVRNPFARILSAYNDKMVRRSTGYTHVYGRLSEKINKQFRHLRQNKADTNKTDDGSATLEDFVNFLLSDDQLAKDYHWNMYDQICQPCLHRFDYITKFETMTEDMSQLASMLNFTEAHKSIFFRRRNYRTQPDKVEKAFAVVPRQLTWKLYQKYRKDFELFGYQKPSWL